jgi:hypothetical protein
MSEPGNVDLGRLVEELEASVNSAPVNAQEASTAGKNGHSDATIERRHCAKHDIAYSVSLIPRPAFYPQEVPWLGVEGGCWECAVESRLRK